MNDIDDPMRGYRPSGPPPDLRARILSEAHVTRQVRLLDWLPAIAAAALVALLQVLASQIRNSVYDEISGPIVTQQVEVSLQ